MTIETEDYATKILMESGKQRRHNNGWRSLHTDFINNKESDGYHVTYVNGLDNPDNDPTVIAQRTQERLDRIRIEELRVKIRNDSITQRELVEYMRLTLT